MIHPRFVDISKWNGPVSWSLYAPWSRQWDGIGRVSIKATEGTGFTDPNFSSYKAGALASGIEHIIYYAYARPQWNSPEAEADWLKQVVPTLTNGDLVMLDLEEQVVQANADWAYRWLSRTEQNYGGRLPLLYASASYIQSRLQDARLARFPLVLAEWTYDPNTLPACPGPWNQYSILQYSDKGVVPGILGNVDVNVVISSQGGFMTPDQEKQALCTWRSTTVGAIPTKGNATTTTGTFPAGSSPSYTTGIAKAWQAEYGVGRNWGPPTSYEYDTVDGVPLTDWSGNPLMQQNFLGGRYELNLKTGVGKWYRWGGV